MRKQSATLEGEAISSSGEKRPRRSLSDEGAQKDWAIVLVESPDQPALGDCPAEVSKGVVSSLHARVDKDREDTVKDYEGYLELIFAYGYGCYSFKNNICGDWLEILDGMPDSTNSLPPEFFSNLKCPSAPRAVEAKYIEVA